MKERVAIPGDRLGVIEEFEPGEGAATRDGVVRAHCVGEAVADVKKHVVSVKKVRVGTRIPSPGDTVVGKVETAQSFVINVLIHYLNKEENTGGFTGMITLGFSRPQGRGRPRKIVICKPGDWIRASVVSNKNAIIHLSLDGSEDGVIQTCCSVCGGKVFRSNDVVRCGECGNIEDRKMAPDFNS